MFSLSADARNRVTISHKTANETKRNKKETKQKGTRPELWGNNLISSRRYSVHYNGWIIQALTIVLGCSEVERDRILGNLGTLEKTLGLAST